MSLENLEALASFHIPDAKGLVVTPRNNAPPIDAQDDGVDRFCMPLEHLEALASLHIPDARGLVPTPRNNAPPIGAQDEGVDPACMTIEHLEALASFHIPDAKRLVVTPRNNAPPIGAQDEGVDGRFMPLKHLEALASLHIPDTKRLVATPRNNTPPIGAQDEGLDPACMIIENRLAHWKRIINFLEVKLLKELDAIKRGELPLTAFMHRPSRCIVPGKVGREAFLSCELPKRGGVAGNKNANRLNDIQAVRCFRDSFALCGNFFMGPHPHLGHGPWPLRFFFSATIADA